MQKSEEKARVLTLDDALANAQVRPSDVAFALRVSYGTVSKWRKRAACPRGDHLVGLARLVGLTPEEVLDLVLPQAEADAAWVLRKIEAAGGSMSRDELEAAWNAEGRGQ